MTVVEKIYRPYGNVRRLFKWMDGIEDPPMETLVEGPAGTGKTRAICEFHYELCTKYANTRILVVRKFRADLHKGWQRTFEEDCLYPGHPLLTQKGYGQDDKREKYVFPNGSEIVLGHMDVPERWYSSEWDLIYWNEATESRSDQWIKLGRACRKMSRPTKCPFRLLMGDTNPHLPRNHLNLRCNSGRTLRITTKHADNPAMEQDYLERLRAMTGVDRRRLYLGEWCSAEGMVIDCWDEEKHIVPHDDLPAMAYHVVGMDFGYKNPGSIIVLGYPKGGDVAYVVEEVYRKGDKNTGVGSMEWWGEQAARIHDKYKPVAFIADSAEPRSIQFLNSRIGGEPHVMPVAKTKVGTKKWGEATRNHLRTLIASGKLFILDDPMRLHGGPDTNIEEGARCLTDEISMWEFKRARTGTELDVMQREDPDPKCDDHSIDALIYALTWGWRKDFTPEPPDSGLPDDSLGSILGHGEVPFDPPSDGTFDDTPESWRN